LKKTYNEKKWRIRGGMIRLGSDSFSFCKYSSWSIDSGKFSAISGSREGCPPPEANRFFSTKGTRSRELLNINEVKVKSNNKREINLTEWKILWDISNKNVRLYWKEN
jgi:hypothetical protein